MSRVTNDRGCYNCGWHGPETEGNVTVCPNCRITLSGEAVFFTIDAGRMVEHRPNGQTIVIEESNLNNRSKLT